VIGPSTCGRAEHAAANAHRVDDQELPIHMTDISVIICTRNPRPDHLSRVLDALRSQTLPTTEWEMLLVDNASDAPLAQTWSISWHPRSRHIREDEIGLTPARLRGIRESRGELLVYVDDDNVLDADYLLVARTIMSQHPHLGVIGAGIIEPEFAVQPPPELVSYLGLLALRRASTDLWTNNTDDLACVPWGPGLCVRRQVADSYQLLHRASRDPRPMKRACNGMAAASGTEVGLYLVPRTRISVGPAASRAPRTVAWGFAPLSTHFRVR
jgi:glycosyltransferase involved in cell wall biosynthesis